ncbi:DUF6716 putative glycosyltransferase [Demequina silvatica]|uniref:DUF6716 putative glycosyltransferase n=1 Tax=Demequina silvatica TaxID=1638988 RepID=UPI000784E1D2|nr:DUF6716 putative glycosyltransferase [Demequina silvatica]
MAEPTPAPRPRALVVADSDSYLKWAVRRAEDLRETYDVELLVVRNAVTPSAAQMDAAVDGRLSAAPAIIGMDALVSRLRLTPPALLLLACRGPLIELLLLERLGGRRAATVVAAGIPGIWYPPTELGLRLRAACDLMVVHSERERDAVAETLPQGRLRAVGLASLIEDQEVGRSPRPRIVFAPQALVPAALEDRRRLLASLGALAAAHPELDVVVKLRGVAGEAQTHKEAAPYDALAEGMDLPGNLVFAQGPLRAYLGDCEGFVTVSSTAALEAIAAGVPTLVLDEFGVSADVINAVFEGSGLFGGLADLEARRFRAPDPDWLAANYFHGDDDWVEVARGMEPGDPAPLPDRLASPLQLRRRMFRRAVALGDADTSLTGRLMRLARPLVRWLESTVRGRRK